VLGVSAWMAFSSSRGGLFSARDFVWLDDGLAVFEFTICVNGFAVQFSIFRIFLAATWPLSTTLYTREWYIHESHTSGLAGFLEEFVAYFLIPFLAWSLFGDGTIRP
jgi:hypothetical protein